MKVNFNVALKNGKGQDTYEEMESFIDGKKVFRYEKIMIKDLVSNSLYAGTTLDYTNDEEKDAAIKRRAYRLSQKVSNADGPIDITPEEICMIKKCAIGYRQAGTYQQIIDLVTEEDN